MSAQAQSPGSLKREPEHHSQKWLLRQSIAAFRSRADKWESEQGEIGKIVASELRVIIDCFDEILEPPTETK